MASSIGNKRPLSPHLLIYRLSPTMVMSGLHRITGFVMYFGTLIVAWWVVAVASGPQAYELAQRVLGSWIGILVLVGYSWSLIHHMLGGLRHLIWDTGRGLGKAETTAFAHATWIGSAVLTVLFWAAIWFGRG